MKLIFVFVLCVFCANCSRHTCLANTRTNKELFIKYLNIIKSRETHGKMTLVEEYREALNYLSLVSGIESKADYSSTFGYKNKSDYKSDMKQWVKWYKENQCKITEHYVDSVYRRVGLRPPE